MSRKKSAVRRIVDLDAFRTVVKAGKTPRTGVALQMRLLAPQAADAAEGAEESRIVSFVFSDASVDRYGDTIDVQGWSFDETGAGTVALFGHDPGDPENVIGRAYNVRVAGNELVGDIHFAEAAVNPKAEIVYRMVKAGYLNTVSVGFDPIEWSPSKTRKGGIDFKRQELMEISIVPIPANKNAVVLAKAAGINVDRLGLLERAGAPRGGGLVRKGLYDVSTLAEAVTWLSCIARNAAWEEEYEGDGSDVPERLAALLVTAGEILVDMTAEEVAELIASVTGETETKAAGATLMRHLAAQHRREAPDLAAIVKAAVAEALPAAGQRAGRTISAGNEKSLRDAHDLMSQACDLVLAVAGANETREDGDVETDDPAALEAKAAAEARRRRAAAIRMRAGLPARAA